MCVGWVVRGCFSRAGCGLRGCGKCRRVLRALALPTVLGSRTSGVKDREGREKEEGREGQKRQHTDTAHMSTHKHT